MPGSTGKSRLTNWKRSGFRLCGNHPEWAMTRFLIMLTCLFASATLSAALALFTGWPVALLAGGLAFLFTQHVSTAFARRHDKHVTAREIAALRRVSLEF